MDAPALPKTFTDDDGRKWTVVIRWSTCKRMEAVAGVVVDDLVSIGSGKEGGLSAFRALVSDFYKLSEALYAILKPECDALEPPLTLEAFQDGIVGNSVLAARDAFTQALIDFFPEPRKSLLGSACGMGKRTEAAALKKMDDEMGKLTTALDERIKLTTDSLDLVAEFQRNVGPLNPPFSAAPASSASTPILGTSGS